MEEDIQAKRKFIKIDYIILSALHGNYEATALLQYIYSLYKYWKGKHKLSEGGFFFLTIENVQEKLFISKYKQQKILTFLQDAGYISISYRGLPRKRFVSVNEVAVERIFLQADAQNIQKALNNEAKQKEERKKLFYERLNSALSNLTYREIYSQGGNISNDMMMVLYVWKKMLKLFQKKDWDLNAKDYGIFKYWIKKQSQQKTPINFGKIIHFLQKYNGPSATPAFFTLWDKSKMDDVQSKLYFNNLKEIQDFIENFTVNLQKHDLFISQPA